jgi:epsilon-lactone hydrolase
MFRDSIRRYVLRLREQGVRAEAQEYDGMFHVFQMLMPWAQASQQSFRLIRDFIHGLLEPAAPLIPGEIKSRLQS